MGYVMASVFTLLGLLFLAWALGTCLWRSGRRGPLVAAVITCLRWPVLAAAVAMTTILIKYDAPALMTIGLGLGLPFYWATDWDTGTRKQGAR
jgi:hypothetical protein